MLSSNPNEANNFLQNTIKLKTRTLKPYEKKFVRKGEFRYDVPIQSSIPSGQPTLCYARNAEVPINQQADTPLQQTSHSAQLDTCSQPSEDMPRTALSGQNVAHNFETIENEAMSTEETEEKFPRPVQTKTYTETTEEDYVDSPISPSRTHSTVTSGDLGDISSSLSRSSSSGPSSLEAHRLGSEVVVSQSSENTSTLKTRKSLDKGPISASPRDIHNVSESETYSPLDVSSIHKTSDRRISSENLFTSPDTSKGEEEVKKAAESSGLSDAITCAQRTVVEPVQRSEESEPLFILPKPITTGSSDSSNLRYSPEIPNQDTAISTTKPDKLEDKTDSVKATAELKDTRIMAKWKDTHFYPGVIKEVMGKSRYRVQFDDGDILILKGCDILRIEKLPVGQTVMVLSKDGYFYNGIIMAESKKGDIIQYTVDQDNGISGKFSYSQVILSEGQAACMIADLPCQLSQPSADSEDVTVKNPNVSLENLVVGKRRKESRYEQQNVSVMLQEEEKPGPSSSKKRKTPFSPTPDKRRNVTGPATSTPRVTKRRKVSEDVNPESTPPTSAITSPITPRRSRKGSSTPKPPKLFQGMYFMLTHVERTPEVIAIEKEILRDSSLETSADESGHDDEDHIPFDKDFLKKKIRSEGGVILDKIDKHSKLKSPLFLISDVYHRTVKYFQSLAAGLPCVSHLWIRDSIHHHTVLDHKSYILQAGISFQKKKVVEWNARRGDLAMMTIMVESEKDKMIEEWSNILQIADATVVDKLHSRRDTDGVVQVLVTDSSCKAQVLRSAKSLNLPIVSTEWIIQCLINGQVMDFTGHPRYQYDFAVI